MRPARAGGRGALGEVGVGEALTSAHWRLVPLPKLLPRCSEQRGTLLGGAVGMTLDVWPSWFWKKSRQGRPCEMIAVGPAPEQLRINRTANKTFPIVLRINLIPRDTLWVPVSPDLLWVPASLGTNVKDRQATTAYRIPCTPDENAKNMITGNVTESITCLGRDEGQACDAKKRPLGRWAPLQRTSLVRGEAPPPYWPAL